MQLRAPRPCAGGRGRGDALGIERRQLVRVFARAQVGDLASGRSCNRSGTDSSCGRRYVRHVRVVDRAVLERLGGQAAARIGIDAVGAPQLLEQRVVVGADRRPAGRWRNSWPRRAAACARRCRCSRARRSVAHPFRARPAGTDTGWRRRCRSARGRAAPARPGGSGSSRSARMPPWTAGCSVLTRPPSISGKPVSS